MDRKANKARIYYGFNLDVESDIPAELRNVSFDALDLNIGQDGTGHYNAKLAAQLDEVIITSDVLDDKDVAKLKAYYE